MHTPHLDHEVISIISDFNTISIPDALVLNSVSLIETHSLNSVDALVLQSAMDVDAELRKESNRLVLVASDQRLLRAANSEGLLVYSPETDSQQNLTDWITHI